MMVPVPNRIFIDLGPLRESRGFRLLFAGEFVEVFGSQLTAVAIPFQVYSLTRSSLQVGLVSLAQLVPLIAGALIGGSLGDALDRRRILLVASALLALTSGGLAATAAAAHPSLIALYLVSALAAGLAGASSTASNAAVPALVAPRHLVPAYASTQAVSQVGSVVGPALAGLAIEAVHLQWVYATTAVIYLLTALAAARMPAIPPAPAAGALVGALTTGWLNRINRQAWAVIVAVCVWGAAIVAFGLVHVLWIALALLALAGWADVLSAVLRSTILQTCTSEEYRSRVSAVQIAVGTRGAPLRGLGAGTGAP